jgi:hypothetical protein
MTLPPISYKRDRFPDQIIAQAVWPEKHYRLASLCRQLRRWLAQTVRGGGDPRNRSALIKPS